MNVKIFVTALVSKLTLNSQLCFAVRLGMH
jgi:hypothetical protein